MKYLKYSFFFLPNLYLIQKAIRETVQEHVKLITLVTCINLKILEHGAVEQDISKLKQPGQCSNTSYN